MSSEWSFDVPSSDAMREYGRLLGTLLKAGDLIMLDGPLGAGKTTLTQGIAQGMGVSERITSPTYVIAVTHRTPEGTPNLVHVDAYRLGSYYELDDLDLDSALDDSVLVIEWGAEMAEALNDDRLEIGFWRPGDAVCNEEDIDDPMSYYRETPRQLSLRATGERSRALVREFTQARASNPEFFKERQ